MLPNFKYHPNCVENEVFTEVPAGQEKTCMCFGKQTCCFYETMMYGVEDVDCLCPQCIVDGSAVRKFDGTFVQDAEAVSSKEKPDELFCRTPGLATWQGEYWLTCWDDYCACIAYVGIWELEKWGF